MTYKYDGPIFRFGEPVGKLKTYTTAKSYIEAMNYFKYKAKEQLGLKADTRVELDPKFMSSQTSSDRVYIQTKLRDKLNSVKGDPNQLTIDFNK